MASGNSFVETIIESILPLTDEQVEQAARILCEKRGRDPDGVGMFYDGLGKLWKQIVPEIREHERIHDAINSVR